MTAQHTPGPWIAYEWECSPRFNEDGNRFWGIKPEKFHYGAEYLDTAGWMSEANARLIAEAPALVDALREGVRAIGDHFAPNDCYVTGPVTGDLFRDLVQCPACSFLAMAEPILARIDGGEK